MVGHKCRSLDSVLNASKEIGALEIQGRRSARLNKIDMPPNASSGEGSSKRKRKYDIYEDLSDDWTEEHLREPRKTEKRKSLNELKECVDGSVVVWTRKSKRKLQIKTEHVKADMDIGNTSENFKDNSDLQKEETLDSSNIGTQEAMMGTLNSLGNIPVDKFKHSSDECDSDTSPERARNSENVDQRKQSDYQLRTRLTQPYISDSKQKHVPDHDGPSQGNSGLIVSETMTSARCNADISNAGIASSEEQHALKIESMKALPSGREHEFCAVPVVNGDSATCDIHEKGKTHGLSDKGEMKLDLAERRRCGLCGGNSKGEPPDYLLPASNESETNQNNGSERGGQGYSEWDAFGSEPGWLGKLLGPLDHFGIAGVWVHQECAIWSPEVYFAGVGCIKNIRAALRRGKLLKCSRCTRPGATIGCHLERCPRTYHLPCARFEGCFFDHNKFVMACDEHLHYFLPRLPGCHRHRNSLNLGQIRLKRKIGEWKKFAQKAALLDVEAEEKWQEKAGVDEEFLRRERKRLQRDLSKIRPVIVGGSDGVTLSDDWESIAGSGNVVQCMKEMVILPLLYPETFTNLGVSPPRGVLLHGHPGTGKTLAVKALIGACAKGHNRIAYFARKGADCLGKYVGDAERQLRLLFYMAEKHQPSIIFFDEIDGLAPTRSQHQDQTHKSVVSTLLVLMDGIKSRGSVVVIGATNRPDSLDPALRRPGRFDREIYFPLPSYFDRTSILTVMTRRWRVPPEADVISMLAKQTAGFAGADLQALCAEAAMNSLRRVISLDDLIEDAEKKGIKEPLSSPNLNVSTVDWAFALEKISPPSSWRSAKAAVNIVPNAPLPYHMVPVFLKPMVFVIISLYLDHRVALPPILGKVATLLEERFLSHFGASWVVWVMSFVSGTIIDCPEELEKELEDVFSSCGMVSRQGSKTVVTPNVTYKGSKFRVLISGKQKTGLDYLASWLLYGFEGFLEMCNFNLTTLLQEGAGDLIQGIIALLGIVQGKCPCLIFMPQLETWAVEYAEDNAVRASQCWNVFVQQVNLMSSTLQIIFLASTEMQKDEIPVEIVDFFLGTAINPCFRSHPSFELLSSCRSVPSSWVEVLHAANLNVIFNRATDYYGELFSETFLNFKNAAQEACILRPHLQVFSTKQNMTCEGGGKHHMNGDEDHDDCIKDHINADEDDGKDHKDASRNHIYSNKDHENGSRCHRDDRNDQEDCSEYHIDDGKDDEDGGKDPDYEGELHSHSGEEDSDKNQNDDSENEDDEAKHDCLNNAMRMDYSHDLDNTEANFKHSDIRKWDVRMPFALKSSGSQTSRKNFLSFAISTVGYQLLYHPELRELRHATSKLKEGPTFVVKTLRKKFSVGSSDGGCSHNDELNSKGLKGLVAVGLLAYNGSYMTATDVALAVKEVLRLLNIRINAKVNLGKDPGQFSHLFHQAAALDDKIFSWAHNFHRLENIPARELLPGGNRDGGQCMEPPLAEVSDKHNAIHQNILGPMCSNNVTRKEREDDLPVLVSAGQKSNGVTPDFCDGTSRRFSKHYCAECLQCVKQELEELFIRSWMSRSKDNSLDIADVVIGTCTSAVSIALDGIFQDTTVQCATSSHEDSCMCRSTHEKEKKEEMNHIFDSNGSNETRSGSGLMTADSEEGLQTTQHTCLCSLIKIISNLK